MNTLALAPLQWSSLKNIDEVSPINDGDSDCLIAVREVLKKFGKRDRFGIALLHRHFDLANDEIMLETCDPETRTLISRPAKAGSRDGKNVATVLELLDGDINVMSWCRSYCKVDWLFGGHSSRHHEER